MTVAGPRRIHTGFRVARLARSIVSAGPFYRAGLRRSRGVSAVTARLRGIAPQRCVAWAIVPAPVPAARCGTSPSRGRGRAHKRRHDMTMPEAVGDSAGEGVGGSGEGGGEAGGEAVVRRPRTRRVSGR